MSLMSRDLGGNQVLPTERKESDQSDQRIIDLHADRLNREAMDTLEYQSQAGLKTRRSLKLAPRGLKHW